MPDAYDPTLPVGTSSIQIPEEFRAIKAALVEQRTEDTNQAGAIANNTAATAALTALLAGIGGRRFVLLTGSGQVQVPASITSMVAMAVGGGQGGQAGHHGLRPTVNIPNWYSSTVGGNNPSIGAATVSANPLLISSKGSVGLSGVQSVSTITVVAGETLDYVCGAGGDEGVAESAISTISVNAAPVPSQGIVGNPFVASNQNMNQQLEVLRASLEPHVNADPTSVTMKTETEVGALISINNPQPGADFIRLSPYTKVFTEFTTVPVNTSNGFGAKGAIGGNSTLIRPEASSTEPAVTLVDTGVPTDNYVPVKVDTTAETMLGQFGAGGAGGDSRVLNVPVTVATDGFVGAPGAILLMW